MSKITRYRKVFAVLARYGFGDVVSRLSQWRFLSGFVKQKAILAFDANRWRQLRQSLEALGPTYIKFGQILSNRPGLLPDALVEELALLQDSVAPISFLEVKKVIEESFGKPLQALFRDFEEVPVASASIAQVHKAWLHSGEKVAVKIQRPGIAQIIQSDILMMNDLAGLMERYIPELRSLQPRKLVKAFEQAIFEELDFRRELSNIQYFVTAFEQDHRVKIPKPFVSFCNTKVLVTEFVEGTKINRKPELLAKGISLKQLAQSGFDIYFKQIFEWGFFHADPHPGNLLVQDDGRLVILDFGMTGRLSRTDKLLLTRLIIGLGKDDFELIVDTVEKLSRSPIYDKAALESDLTLFLNDFGNIPVKQLDLNAVLLRARALIQKHQLQLNTDLYLLLRTVSMLEGLGISLDPDFRSLDTIKPYAASLISREFSWKKLFNKRKLAAGLWQLNDFLQRFPTETLQLYEKVLSGQIKTSPDKSYQIFLGQLHKQTARRIGRSVILAAGLMAGAILWVGGMAFQKSYAEYTGFTLMLIALVSIAWNGFKTSGN